MTLQEGNYSQVSVVFLWDIAKFLTSAVYKSLKSHVFLGLFVTVFSIILSSMFYYLCMWHILHPIYHPILSSVTMYWLLTTK